MKRSLGAKWLLAAAGIAGCLLAVPHETTAQMVGPRFATRPQLAALLDSLQNVNTVTMSEERRRELQLDVSGLALRLQNGDVAPGDQIALTVIGHPEWTGRFAVSGARTLELPEIEPVDLSGLLYSEVEERLSSHLGRYLREPRIRVEVLKRIGVVGAVQNPGFYGVSGSMLVSDVIMTAGGPTGNANMKKLEFRRRGENLESIATQVVWESQTLDQLGLTSGDEVFIPERGGTSFWIVFSSIVGLVGTVTWLITRL